jgi:hypothetical protein
MPRKTKRTQALRKNKKTNKTRKMRGGVWYDPRSWFTRRVAEINQPTPDTEKVEEPKTVTDSSVPASSGDTQQNPAPDTDLTKGGKSKKRVKRN